MNIRNIGDGNVVLIAGGGKVYTDIAARFCHSNKDLEDIIASPYNKNIVKNIISSGHLAATEFDNFIFGIEGYARVTEVQLVRKRMASYLITSGRDNRHGKREFNIVIPDSIKTHDFTFAIEARELFKDSKCTIPLTSSDDVYYTKLDVIDILSIIEEWYNSGVEKGLPEEDLRYMKPQGTEFKAIISMNTHALLDWFKIRTCKNAQTEIRDLATKMMKLCKSAAPDLFKNAGPSCKVMGYCPENSRQNKKCKVITQEEAMKVLSEYKKSKK